jgi:hypothetical protein
MSIVQDKRKLTSLAVSVACLFYSEHDLEANIEEVIDLLILQWDPPYRLEAFDYTLEFFEQDIKTGFNVIIERIRRRVS